MPEWRDDLYRQEAELLVALWEILAMPNDAVGIEYKGIMGQGS